MTKKSKTITEDAEQSIYIDTLEGAKKMLEQIPDINYEIGKEGSTLLELVYAFTTDVEVVHYLLERGADIHHTDHYGRNAFAYAWFNHSAPYMDVFINHVLKKYWNKTPNES